MKLPSRKPEFTLILAAVLCLSGFSLLYLYPSRSVASIWTGYRTLVVSAAEGEDVILARLEGQGIVDLVTQSNSIIKNTNREAPDQPFLAVINTGRQAWFLDPEGKLRYFYLREIPFLGLKVADGLSGATFFWHLEAAEGMVYFPFFLTVLLFIFGLLLARNRLYQFSGGLPFLLLPLSSTRPSGFIAAILAIYTVILASDLSAGRARLDKIQLARRFRSQPFVIVTSAGSILAALSGGLHPFLLLCAAATSSLAAIVPANAAMKMAIEWHEKRRLHPVFVIEAMHPGTVSRGWSGRLVMVVSSAAAACALAGILLFAFRSVKTDTGREKDLYIPAPARYTGNAGLDLAGYTAHAALEKYGTLPDLGDFIATQWRMRTFSWQRVQLPSPDPTGSSVAEFTYYSIDGDGVISEHRRVLETFDTGFIRKTLSSDGTPLEKMLLAQDRFVTVSRTDDTGNRTSSGGTSALWYVFFLAIPGAAVVMRLKK